MDFSKRSTGIYLTLGATKWAAWKFLAITTSILFIGLGVQYAQEHFPGYEVWAATLAGLLGWATVDYGLGPMVAYYFDNKKEAGAEKEKNPAKHTLLRIMLILVIVRSLASMTISFWAAGEVADMATSHTDPQTYIDAIQNQDDTKLAAITTAKAVMDKQTASERKRVQEAKKAGHSKVSAAINDGDTWQRKSYRQNRFSWLESSANRDKKDKAYAASIRQARADSAAIVQAELQRTQNAEQAYNALLSDKTTETAKRSILGMSQKEQQLYEERKQRRTTLLIFADFFFGILGWLCEYVQALMRQAGVRIIRQRTFAHVLREILVSWAEWFLAGLERLLKIDIDGNGDVGTVGKKKSRPTPKTSAKDEFLAMATATGSGGTTGATMGSTTTPATADATTTTPATTGRAVVQGFRPATPPTTTTTPADTTPLQRVDKKPPTPVATGVSAGLTTPPTTTKATPEQVTVVVVDGRKFVVHNGKERGLDWVTKTRAVYVGRLKDYRKKGKDTTNVEANLALFDRYIEQLTAED